MRRGTERFMGLPARVREQLAVLLPALAVFAWLGPQREDAPLRIVLAYGVQALIVVRTLFTIQPALLHEFCRATMRVLQSQLRAEDVLGRARGRGVLARSA